jgi:hypothetical protein
MEAKTLEPVVIAGVTGPIPVRIILALRNPSIKLISKK